MLFKAKKIKKLIEKYRNAENAKEGQRLLSELRQFDQSAIQHVITAFQQRTLIPEKAQFLLEALCDDTCFEKIFPLISDHQHDVRRFAKEMILKRWGNASSPQLIEYLVSSDFYSRDSAAELLTLLKDKSSVPKLISLFKRANPDLKGTIIQILSGIGHPAGNELIISALDDESTQVCIAAVKGLKRVEDSENAQVPILIKKLKEEDPRIRDLAMDVLGDIGDKRAARPMIEFLKNEDLIMRQKATEHLIALADADVVPDILNLMKSQNVNTRRCAIEVLNNLKDPRTSDALLNAIRDSDWWVRQIATDSLTEIKGDNIVKGFIAMMEDTDETLRRCAVEFFNQVVHKAALPALIELLKDEDWWVREKAIAALGKQKDKRAISPLADLIDDEDVNWSVPGAFAEIGGIEVVEPLKKFLFVEESRVRKEAIRAFGKLKWKDAVPDLTEFLQDHDKDVRSEAARVLKEITGKTVRVKKRPPSAGNGSQKQTSKKNAVKGMFLTEAVAVVDFCDSTSVSSRYGDNFAMNMMETLTETIMPIAKSERYQFMKNTGDGFLITFSEVENSVRFAFDTLQEVSRYNATVGDAKKIHIRFGINFGETRVKEDKDRIGVAVNMAFRVEGLKPDGLIPVENGMTKEEMPIRNRILITENCEKEIKNLNGIKTKLIGLFELKGITGLHKIYELTSDKPELLPE